MQKYSVNQHLIETILAWVNSGEIAIPEIQRPFVWDSSKVRDLMDSLYQGYPIGYVIAWRNPNVKLKDGSLSEGKKVLIVVNDNNDTATFAIAFKSYIATATLPGGAVATYHGGAAESMEARTGPRRWPHRGRKCLAAVRRRYAHHASGASRRRFDWLWAGGQRRGRRRRAGTPPWYRDHPRRSRRV